MPSRRVRSNETLAPDAGIDAYHVFWFDEIADAVECCGRLVPHVVARGGVTPERALRPVVWFHVPKRATASTRDGCYLLASPGALAAFSIAAPSMRPFATITHDAIPAGAVLILGDDALPATGAPPFDRVVRQSPAVADMVPAHASGARAHARITPTVFTPANDGTLIVH